MTIIIPNGEKLKNLSKSWKKTSKSNFMFIQHSLGIPNMNNQARQRCKEYPNWKIRTQFVPPQ
jgi:hypothetical protein